MSRFKYILVSAVLPSIAAALVTLGYQSTQKPKMQLCKHPFALCTSAKCIPQPGNSARAICSCDVQEGTSMATAPCKTLEPSTDANGIRTVYSTFSFIQFEQGLKGMKCPSGTPWTWCLNKRCTVDPENPSKAIYICDVLRTGDWMTLGGNCDPSTCKTGYWSGATLSDHADSEDFMMKMLGMNKTPVKWCEVGSK